MPWKCKKEESLAKLQNSILFKTISQVVTYESTKIIKNSILFKTTSQVVTYESTKIIKKMKLNQKSILSIQLLNIHSVIVQAISYHSSIKNRLHKLY